MRLSALRLNVFAAETVDLDYEVRSTMGELKSEKSPSLFTAGMKSQNGLGNISQVGQYIRTREDVFFGIRSKKGLGFLISEGYTYSNHHHSHNLDSLGGARQWNFSTVVSLSNLSRNDYSAPLDTKFGGGLIHSLNKRPNPWLKLGFGDRIGITERTERPYGTSAEVFTTADFLITPTIFIGPHIHFPLYSEGPTYSDIPVDPANSNISAEFFMQIAL